MVQTLGLHSDLTQARHTLKRSQEILAEMTDRGYRYDTVKNTIKDLESFIEGGDLLVELMRRMHDRLAAMEFVIQMGEDGN